VEPDEAGKEVWFELRLAKGQGISVSRPDIFTVRTGQRGALVLTGELDVATIQELQDKIDEIMVPGQAIVLTWPTSPSWIAVPCIVWSGP
jgi:hypothetical protein